MKDRVPTVFMMEAAKQIILGDQKVDLWQCSVFQKTRNVYPWYIHQNKLPILSVCPKSFCSMCRTFYSMLVSSPCPQRPHGSVVTVCHFLEPHWRRKEMLTMTHPYTVCVQNYPWRRQVNSFVKSETICSTCVYDLLLSNDQLQPDLIINKN